MKKCHICGSDAKDHPEGIRCLSCMYTGPALGAEFEIRAANNPLQKSGETIYEENINAVLEIKADGLGSGFVISRDGYAITSAHVVIDREGKIPKTVTALVMGRRIPARVVDVFGESGSLNDIALLQLEEIPQNIGFVTLGDSDALKNGQQSYVIGNSRGMGTCIMAGIVSDKNRNGFVMTNDMAKHGNSGGPLFTADGCVFGVLTKGVGVDTASGITAKREEVVVAVEVEGMNLSIPINHVKRLIKGYGIV